MTKKMRASPEPTYIARSISAIASRPALAITLFICAITAILLVALPRPLSPDISGQLWIADRLRHGARLYIDISEINPPLWFWLAMPIDLLADLMGIRAEDGLITVMGGAALASLLATDRLLIGYTPALRTPILLYAACILLIMPLRDLGQREQMALIGAVPYAALIAARRQGLPVSAWLAGIVGFGAAIGFALKHYFVGVPLLLEVWLLFSLRRKWRPFRIELLVLMSAGLGYFGAILIVTPGYLRVSVPELALAYGAVGAPGLQYMIRPAQPVWLLILCGMAAERGVARRPLPPITMALLTAAAGFFIGWAIQHKGWPYQSIATTGTLAIAMATALADLLGRPGARPRLIAVVALIGAVSLFLAPTQWVPVSDSDIAAALADLKSGDAIAIISNEGRTAWPSTVGRGLRFAGRRGSFWIFAAVDANMQGKKDPRIAALGRNVVAEAVRDYRCLPPKRIIFSPGKAARGVISASDNPLGYFNHDPDFMRLIQNYRRLELPGHFDAFQLVRPLNPLRDARCPRGI
ncbi:hypothetical protein ASG11_10500 [Sphingomonas sp. Leaf357]|uniref:hypothetical protein n=1 Tax=Sphingomonas sp. Leaf357 TaxID=1736350 RepID=UPI0006F400A5|nr:hypothetical protein [Sphingomonas sp. Leaf357]KQS04626.1 hypothetical protein ASG11_10500 [Sphingomonas sp. Leaf357]